MSAEVGMKEIKIGDGQFRVKKIPCLPGVELFAQCAPIVDMTRWNEITNEMVLRLVRHAEILVVDKWESLAEENKCKAFLSTEQIWLLAQEVYVFNFGFFIAGGILSVMAPLLKAKKEADKSEETEEAPGSHIGM